MSNALIGLPPLAIVLFTCNRPDYARRTLRSALDGVQYRGPLHVHMADDGSPAADTDDLLRLAGGYPQVQAVSATNAERGGYGRSYNLATQHLHGALGDMGLVLALEDDWELLRPLDLDPLAVALADERLGCIRLGYVGYTQRLAGEFVFVAGAHYLLLDAMSAEPHVFAGHPRLETVAWERTVGPWPEGMNAGATEFTVAHRLAARRGVAWPLDLVHPRGDLFAHIGAVQARTDQRPIEAEAAVQA